MSRRLANLLERGLVERKGFSYSATREGLAYLNQTGARGPGDSEVWNLVRKKESRVRQALHESLHDIDPYYGFEHLIGQSVGGDELPEGGGHPTVGRRRRRHRSGH